MAFAEFYQLYPRKIARKDAEKAYAQVQKEGVTDARIMAGLDVYLQHLPEETCFIPYPASWLRAWRFDDEYESARPAKEYWFDECQREHGGACSKQWEHVTKMREAG
jgi:hypothetical protein